MKLSVNGQLNASRGGSLAVIEDPVLVEVQAWRAGDLVGIRDAVPVGVAVFGIGHEGCP